MRYITTDDETRVVAWSGDRESGSSGGRAASRSFGALYDQYAPCIYRYLLSRTGDIDAAKDLTSQTFLTAFEAFPRYRERGCASAWLFSIARSKLVDYIREAHRRMPLPVDPPTRETLDLLGQAIASERVAALKKLIQSLPEKDQELLRLRYVADLTIQEIATLLKRKEGTVKKSLYRLVANLQRRMEALHG